MNRAQERVEAARQILAIQHRCNELLTELIAEADEEAMANRPDLQLLPGGEA